MCGIAGVFDVGASTSGERLHHLALSMSGTLRHRGPDDGGAWVDPDAGVGLGHRRLAVIDLSPTGAQPMSSGDGRWVVAFNGEIYNFARLRADLENHNVVLRGTSDTEVLVETVARLGPRATIDACNGMFAVALFDRQHRRLWLARDRMGEKPLYWAWAGSHFVFASELKALRQHPDLPTGIDRQVVAEYLRVGHVTGTRSILAGVHRLAPGHIACVQHDTAPGSPLAQEAYWTVASAAEAGTDDPFTGSDADAIDAVDELLREAVSMRMEADVPLGAFLSGGVDSSIIAAQMAANGGSVRTFTVAMADPAFDESEHARAVAHHLGTDHVEVTAHPDDARRLVPDLARTWDEPFADPSQLPSLMVCGLARQHVTVALSGDAGDELFGGYHRYQWVPRIWQKTSQLSGFTRRNGARALLAPSSRTWGRVGAVAGAVTGGRTPRLLGDKAQKVSAALTASDEVDMYDRLRSVWPDPYPLVPGAVEEAVTPWHPGFEADDVVDHMMYGDQVAYLPDDILTKVDRASMAVSLEARVPLLDHRLVELSWRLPRHLKIRDGQGRWVVRRVLDRYVPSELIDRPKAGFDPPIGDWLRGPLRQWADDLIDAVTSGPSPLVAAGPVRQAWRRHQSGRRDLPYPLWSVLMLAAWQEEWGV